MIPSNKHTKAYQQITTINTENLQALSRSFFYLVCYIFICQMFGQCDSTVKETGIFGREFCPNETNSYMEEHTDYWHRASN